MTSSVRWARVPGFDQYEVSDTGVVRSWATTYGAKARTHPREIKPYVSKHNGHLRVCLYKDGMSRKKYVHVLVLEAFVGPCPPGEVCRHVFDNNPKNNHLYNLSWGTRVENEADKKRHGTHISGDKTWARRNLDKVVRGSDVFGSKLTDCDVIQIRRMASEGVDQRKIAREFGVSQTAVSRIKLRKTWSHVA